jgi:hypothetical protein
MPVSVNVPNQESDRLLYSQRPQKVGGRPRLNASDEAAKCKQGAPRSTWTVQALGAELQERKDALMAELDPEEAVAEMRAGRMSASSMPAGVPLNTMSRTRSGFLIADRCGKQRGAILHFELKDLLQAIGPTASLVFAAWIFLGFLETRYVAAFERYGELADDYRKGVPGRRHDAVQSQIRLYRRRCEWIRLSTNIGVVSAIALLCTLILAALNVIFSGQAVLTAAAPFLRSSVFYSWLSPHQLWLSKRDGWFGSARRTGRHPGAQRFEGLTGGLRGIRGDCRRLNGRPLREACSSQKCGAVLLGDAAQAHHEVHTWCRTCAEGTSTPLPRPH